MSYTLQPVPTLDTLNSHHGFWALLVVGSVFALLVAWLWSLDLDGDNLPFKVVGFVWFCVLAYAAHVSWSTGTITHYKNVPVVGVLQAYVAEGYVTSERVGKHTKDVPHRYFYVVYAVEGHRIALRTEPGEAWPERAQFYRN